MDNGLADVVENLLLNHKKCGELQDLEDLQKFYLEKKKQGIALRSGYTLSQLDTVGREVQHALRSTSANNVPV